MRSSMNKWQIESNGAININLYKVFCWKACNRKSTDGIRTFTFLFRFVAAKNYFIWFLREYMCVCLHFFKLSLPISFMILIRDAVIIYSLFLLFRAQLHHILQRRLVVIYHKFQFTSATIQYILYSCYVRLNSRIAALWK